WRLGTCVQGTRGAGGENRTACAELPECWAQSDTLALGDCQLTTTSRRDSGRRVPEDVGSTGAARPRPQGPRDGPREGTSGEALRIARDLAQQGAEPGHPH